MKKWASFIFSLLIILTFAFNCEALIMWNWEFDTEAGQFITDGDLVGGIASAGNYQLVDFIVDTSYDTRLLGSLIEGDYQDGAFGTNQPYTFNWDGSQVTLWEHSGTNTFDWWVFQNNNLAVHEYWFAWEYDPTIPIGAVNDPTNAGLVDLSVSAGGNWIRAHGTITVTPFSNVNPIPEPSTIILLGTGLAGLVGFGRKKLKN